MRNTIRARAVLVLVISVGVALAVAALAPAQTTAPQARAESSPLRFAVTYEASITDSFTGRAYVIMTSASREPRRGPAWFGTQPFFALDVSGWKPGDELIFDDSALGYPGPLSSVASGSLAVQAVMRLNPDAPTIGAPGNAYSVNARYDLDGRSSGTIAMHIDRVDEPRRIIRETERLRVVELPSKLLSDFHGRPMTLRAAVLLPRDLDPRADRKYPAFYWIGGFGSDHTAVRWLSRVWDSSTHADSIVRVVLDPVCYGGHHVFADSANNGPVGRALIEELIPHLERTFPLAAVPWGRFVGGHSSGGWSSLWLVVTYPDFFGGVWSLAPDPVDFRDFQQINLYEPGTNMFRDVAGEPRPIARHGVEPFGWYEPFTKMEVVLGDGGQLRSFDWVFSPRGSEGRPQRLYDPRTGAVDAAVAEAWKRYDIRLILETNWPTLGLKLAGKLHVIAGELDTFYLEGAVRLLQESLDRLGSDAVIEIVPGADHGSVLTPALWQRIDDAVVGRWEEGTRDEG